MHDGDAASVGTGELADSVPQVHFFIPLGIFCYLVYVKPKRIFNIFVL